MWVKNIKTGKEWLVSEEHAKKLLKNDDFEKVEKKSYSNGPTVPELKKLAAEKGINGFENMKKDELIAALENLND